jgi:serine/threonine-protein kinase HipA
MMKADPKLNALSVRLQGRPVGIINRLGGDQHLFSFEQDYIDDPDRHTLSLSFKGRTGNLVTRVRPTSRRLPPFFSNLLPEGHLRTYLADQAGVKPEREFFLLAALGADLAGALTIQPLMAGAMAGQWDNDDGDRRRRHDDGVLRFSLAGVQLKFSAVMEAHGSLTIPVHGVGGSWIVKLPSTQFASVPENEYVMLELARAIGITVPETRLVPVEDIHGLPEGIARIPGKAFVVKRFDRASGGHRVHMEDFAQIFGAFAEDKYRHRSYANLAAVLWAETGENDTYEFVRRLVFSVLIGNGDMHLKNWSLLYPKSRQAVLAPAYDFVATLPYIPGDKLALTFGGSRSLHEITIEQVRRFADTAGLPVHPVWRVVDETIERTVGAWKALDHKEILPPPVRAAVDDHIATVAASVVRYFAR